MRTDIPFDTHVKALELKVPPLAVTAMFGLAMGLASWLFQGATAPVPHRAIVAIALACAGGVFGVSGMVSFTRARTTLNPMKTDKASSLVSHGVFRLTRNPMYLGLLLGLAAWAVYLANGIALLLLPLFVLYINEFQIKPEERTMAALFGAAYDEYRARVRRWL